MMKNQLKWSFYKQHYSKYYAHYFWKKNNIQVLFCTFKLTKMMTFVSFSVKFLLTTYFIFEMCNLTGLYERKKRIIFRDTKCMLYTKNVCYGSSVKFVLDKVAFSFRSSHVTHHQEFTPCDLIRINDKARRKEDRAEERKSKLKQKQWWRSCWTEGQSVDSLRCSLIFRVFCRVSLLSLQQSNLTLSV